MVLTVVQFANLLPNSRILLPAESDVLPAYVFGEEEILAIDAAIACHRPLLIRAEPGHPRREFALAVSLFLECRFIELDVDEYPDFQTLLWSFYNAQPQPGTSGC
jgi:hypothetical protein